MSESLFKRFMHIERVRLERQSGRALHSELPNLVLQNKIQFLDNVPSVYSAIGLFMMLIWCPAMGFVFWADNYYRSSSYPFNNGTGYSMIDSVFMTTSAFSNSGLKSAPLFHSTLGGKILILFAMVSYAPHVYDVVGLYLYRRRIAQFIRQHVDSYEWADCAEDLRTELNAADLCIFIIALINVVILSFGFVSLGCYMHFYPGMGADNPSACFGHDCFFIAIFDTISALTHSGHAIQPSGYATFVEHHFLMIVYIVLMLLGSDAFRKGLQIFFLNALRKFGSLRQKAAAEQTSRSVVLRVVMSTDVPHVLWILYHSFILLGSFVYFIYVENLQPLDIITGSQNRSSQLIALLFYSMSLRWTGTFVIDPCLLSSGALHLSLLSMFLPSNPFSDRFVARHDPGQKLKPYSYAYEKALYTILVSIAVMGALPVASTLENTSFNKVYAELFETVSAFFNNGVSLKICIMVCMVVGKMRNVLALGQNLQFVCTQALLDEAQKSCSADKDLKHVADKGAPSPVFSSPMASSNFQALGVAPPSPSPTEPKASLLAAQSEQQVARHILHLKELLRVNQSQLAAGMGAAGLLKSSTPLSLPVSPYISSVPMQFTPMARTTPILNNSQVGAPFTHNADGTRYSEETIVSVPSRTNSFNLTVNPEAVSPSFSPSGYVRRQA